jgi:ribokinase
MDFIAGVGISNCDIIYSGIPKVPKEGEEVRARGLTVKMGGGVIATMITLSRLGIQVKPSTFLGKDIFSNVVEKELRKNALQYTNLYKGKGIPVNVTSTMITTNERTFVSYHDKIKITDQTLESLYQLCKDAKLVEIHPGFLEVYKKLKNDSVTMVLDTGWDDDLSLEKYADYIELADYYTPNCKEALKITGSKTPEDAIRVLGRYFKNPMIKIDKNGCMVMISGKTMIIPPLPNINSVDSTGAGDAFLAGLMYGLFYNYDIGTSVLFGNITGGTCVKKIGCLTNYINEHELLSISESIINNTNFLT